MNIFLSASIPRSDQGKRFHETADVLAIKEAIRSLVEVIIPYGRIVCGGHPAITPLLAMATKSSKKDRNFISIYQSIIYEQDFPKIVYDFIDLNLVDGNFEDKKESLKRMRETMIQSQNFDAIVLIGGMDGVLEELEMFLEFHPNAKVIPLATTGAAAKIIYDNELKKHKPRFQLDPRFDFDYTYSSLFRRIFNHHLNN